VELRVIFRMSVAAAAAVLAGCGPDTASKSAEKPVAAPVDAGVVRIREFYASPANPTIGETAKLCYGVENAEELTLDPPADRVWPAFARCIEVRPSRKITYTLTARHGTASVSQSVTLEPGPKPVRLLEVTIDRPDVPRGTTVMVCFKAKEATSVTIRPGTWMLPHDLEVGCVTDNPQKDTTYVVTATGPGGKATRQVMAKVR
jgi:hypothetical protein